MGSSSIPQIQCRDFSHLFESCSYAHGSACSFTSNMLTCSRLAGLGPRSSPPRRAKTSKYVETNSARQQPRSPRRWYLAGTAATAPELAVSKETADDQTCRLRFVPLFESRLCKSAVTMTIETSSDFLGRLGEEAGIRDPRSTLHSSRTYSDRQPGRFVGWELPMPGTTCKCSKRKAAQM